MPKIYIIERQLCQFYCKPLYRNLFNGVNASNNRDKNYRIREAGILTKHPMVCRCTKANFFSMLVRQRFL